MDNRQAWNLVMQNEGLAYKIANRFMVNGVSQGIDFEWLLQEAYIGIHNAAKTYDPSKSRFSTYAMTCARNHILNMLKKHEAEQGGPRRKEKGSPRAAWVGSIEADREHMLSNAVSNADYTDGDVEPWYLGEIDEGYERLEEMLSSKADLKAILDRADLDEREFQVVEQASLGVQYIEIAKNLGISKQRVEQLRRRAMTKLRRAADEMRELW